MSDENRELSLLIYTDGSAGPTNPGPTGYGAHMIIGDNTIKPKNIIGKYKLTTEGYVSNTEYKNSDKKELLGFLYGVDLYGYEDNSNTNNTAELDAVTLSFKKLNDIKSEIEEEIKHIHFFIDSTYVLNTMEKILYKDLDIKDVAANSDRIEILMNEISKVRDNYNITINKVKAHSDNLGNERADMLANMGRLLRQKPHKENFKLIIGDKTFWDDPKIDNDLFHFKQIFSFYPDTASSDRSYFGLNYKKETEIGKKLSYVSYTVMKTSEVNKPIFETIKIVRDILGERYVPYIIRLSELLNKNILRDYLRFGEDFLIIENKNHFSLKTIRGDEVAREVYPPALSAIVMDRFMKLENELLDFVKGRDRLGNVTVEDITDHIYEKNDKGKTIIKKDLKNDKLPLKLKYENVKINLFTKFDLPPRNTLKRLEKKNPKVSLIVTDHGGLIEYKTMISIKPNDYILTSNEYSNKLLKKKK